MATKKASKKASTKKSFTPEEKTEAVRLITQGNYTLKQAAAEMGCSVASLQNWKKAADMETTAEPTVKSTKKRGKKKTKKALKKATKKSAKKVAKAPWQTKGVTGTAPVGQPPISFDEFAQGYWRLPEASGILSLPSDIIPEAVQYVNNVLWYAYDRLNGQ